MLLLNRRRYYGTKKFGPLSLFANGEQGVWFDPSDLTTLFRDDAGTIPVTADGDPVGLMLDKSQGLVLGPEEITNGSFDDGTTGWSGLNATISASGGQLTITQGSSYPGAVQEFSGVGIYEIMIDVASGSGEFFYKPTLGGTGSPEGSYPIGTGVNRFYLRSTSAVSSIKIGEGSSILVLNTVSIKKVTGNHASQATTSAKPIYRTDGALHWLETRDRSKFMDAAGVPFAGNGFLLSIGCTPYVAVSDVYGGPFRFLENGGSPTGAETNLLETYYSNTIPQRLSVTDRVTPLTIYDNNTAGPALNLPRVLGLSNNATEFQVASLPTLARTSVGQMTIAQDANSTLTIGRGYQGSFRNMDFYGMVYVAAEKSDEDFNALSAHFAAKAGVTL